MSSVNHKRPRNSIGSAERREIETAQAGQVHDCLNYTEKIGQSRRVKTITEAMCHRRTLQISHFGYHVHMVVVEISRVPIEARETFSIACDPEVADSGRCQGYFDEMGEIFLKLDVSNVQDPPAVF